MMHEAEEADALKSAILIPWEFREQNAWHQTSCLQIACYMLHCRHAALNLRVAHFPNASCVRAQPYWRDVRNKASVAGAYSLSRSCSSPPSITEFSWLAVSGPLPVYGNEYLPPGTTRSSVRFDLTGEERVSATARDLVGVRLSLG